MGKKITWSWRSALVGAAAATAAAILINAKPKDPTFRLISVNLTSFKLNFPVLDAELILTVHVTNPNITPIHYSSSTMSILYDGSLLGSAPVEAGSQPSRSCQLLHIPARLDGVELAHHAAKFFSDVAKREMALDAKVDIEGAAKVLWWDQKFKGAKSKSMHIKKETAEYKERSEESKQVIVRLVPILISEPLHVPGMVKLHECRNYGDLATEIARIHSEMSGIPRRPSMSNPMPGFILTYLPPDDDLQNLDPINECWERFSAALDLITAVPITFS